MSLSRNYKKSSIDRLQILNELFLEKLKETKASSIILSHECFIYTADKLLDILIADYNVVVIAYFRRMDHYVESFYGELLSNGAVYSNFSEHLKSAFTNTYLQRYVMLEKLVHKIGQKNIILRPFERSQLHNHDVVDDFFKDHWNPRCQPLPKAIGR